MDDIFESTVKFLNNNLDISKLPSSNVKNIELDDLTVIHCSHQYMFNQYESDFNESNGTVVLLFCDHYWYGDLSFSGSGDRYTKVSESLVNIINISKKFHDKRVILVNENFFTSDEMKLYGKIPNNLEMLTSPMTMYDSFICSYYDNPVIDVGHKTFSEGYHVMCLNNNPRPHRVGVVLYLMYMNLFDNIHVSFVSKERWESNVEYTNETILSFIYPRHNELRHKLRDLSLEHKFKSTSEYVYDDDEDKHSSNMDNFFKNLLPKYQNVAIEIITESTSLEYSAHLTEKFVHCVLGKCFPIIIGTVGNVDLYRKLGYDMFDDIIDHSYDSEENPFYRMKMAIDLNIHILTNKEMAISMYHENEHRLDKNISNYYKGYDMVLNDVVGGLYYMLNGYSS